MSVFTTVAALADADELPGPADDETTFGSGRAFVREWAGGTRGSYTGSTTITFSR